MPEFTLIKIRCTLRYISRPKFIFYVPLLISVCMFEKIVVLLHRFFYPFNY